MSGTLRGRWAWLPVPVLLAVILGLWVADLRTPHESRVVMVVLNVLFTWLASLAICVLTARGFLASGQPGLLMLGCGSLIWGVTSLAAAVVVERLNATITTHNVGVLAAAVCHFLGLVWRGRLARPGAWLAAGYGVALGGAGLIFWAAMAGLTPVFFVQGQGGTWVRQAVLAVAVVLFAAVAWQLLRRVRGKAGGFYQWYGLGLGLVATGLTGVFLLTVQASLLGWVNRLTQYLGSAYLLVAALAAARETGAWKLSFTAVEEAWHKGELMGALRKEPLLFVGLRYGLAVAAVVAGFGIRLGLDACVGPGLPTYLTFFPLIMLVALLGGLGPGVLATALTGLVVQIWLLEPVGQLAIASAVDRVGLILFWCMGVFMSAVAGLYRRNRAKAAAVEREEFYRRILHALPAHIAVLDAQGRILATNPAWEEFATANGAGDAPTVVAGANYIEVCRRAAAASRDDDDAARALAGIEGVLAGKGEPFSMEYACHGPGEQRWFLMTVAPLGAGSEGGAVITHLNITERRRAEEVLRKNNETFRSLIEGNPMGIYVVDASLRMRNASLGAQRAFANVAAPLIGRELGECLRTMWPEPFASEAIGRFRHTLGAGEAWVAPDTMERRRDIGEMEAYDWRLERITLPDGQFGVVCYYYDLTEQRRLEARLRESEERLRLALEGGRMGTWEWDLVTNRSVWNGREFELLGLPAEDGQARAEVFFRHVLAEDAEGVQKSLRETRAGSGEWYHEFRIARTDGQVRWLAGAGRVQRGADGEPERMIGVNYDITEQKEFQAELKRLVDERTERLQELVGELEHFSYTITHDMRAPLRAMRGFAELVNLACADCVIKERRDFLGKIATAAERMDRLITDALSYSRSVRQELPVEEVDSGALLRGMLDTYPELQASKADISVEGRLPVVLGNEAGLTQVFSNLLGNAVKFVKPGELPEVRIWAEAVESPAGVREAAARQEFEAQSRNGGGEWVRIWVEDKGIGISREMLPRVFDMFSRGSKSYEGTGIGLALVRKVMQRMGGKAGVESEAGKGSRFWLELRRSENVMGEK